jgi:hypothetical protein
MKNLSMKTIIKFVSVSVFIMLEMLIAKSYGQASYAWAVNGSQPGDFAEVTDVTVDGDGNSYVLLSYTEPLSFGAVTLNPIGELDLAVVKFDPAGIAQWGVSAGSVTNDKGNAIAVDNTGSVYVTGYITGVASFGILPPVSDNIPDLSSEFFIGKIGPSGQWLWVRQQSSQSVAEGKDVSIDTEGNVVVGGLFYAADLNLDGQILQVSEQLPFVAKYTNSGAIQWAFAPVASNGATFSSLTCTLSNHIAFTGSFGSGEVGLATLSAGNIDLLNEGDPDELITANDVYVIELDENGTPLWGQNAGSIYIEAYAGNITSGPNNQLYVSGYFQEAMQSADASVSIETFGGADDYDYFVASLNNDGSWAWLRAVGNEAYNLGNLILKATNNGAIYLTGSLNDFPIEFGSDILQSQGANSSFVSRMFSDGSFQWGFALPELYSFDVVTENILYVCGKFSGTTAFGDTSLVSTTAAADVYHARILYGPDLPNSTSMAEQIQVTAYPNPFADFIDINCREAIESITVFDALGREVKCTFSSQRITFDQLEPGNYFIRMISSTGLLTLKVVKL